MHRLLILSKYGDEYRRLIEAAGLPELEITLRSGLEQAGDWDLVFAEPTLICLALPLLPALRWAQATWAGVEPLLEPDLRRDYVLTNARGVFGKPMSEYVFGYLLAHERRLLARWEAQRAGRWDPTPPGTLRGKTLGLLGVGSIGAHLAGTAKHFGMRVRGYTFWSEACPEVDEYFHPPARLEFAHGLDYLVGALPNTLETQQAVDAGLLRALPAHAVFINIGRGGAVDEAALAEALQAGRLAGAVLDVFQQEPLPPEHFFWRTPNLLITSHTAALTFPPDTAALFIGNYRRLLRGEPLQYQVDFERGY